MLRVLRKVLMLSLAAAIGVGVVAGLASAATKPNNPAIAFLGSSPATGATLTTDNPAFAFEYNRKPSATKSLTCALTGPSGTTSACNAPTAGGAGSRSGVSYAELDDGSYTLTVSLALSDGGVATASRRFVVAEGACDVENGTTNAESNDLSAAIAAAAAGDRLKIEGTCFGNFVIDKNLTLTGPSALDHATLVNRLEDVTLHIVGGASVSLQHLLITSGPPFTSYPKLQVDASTLEGVDIEVRPPNGFGLPPGGGIQVSGGSLTLRQSVISNNNADTGGGIFAGGADIFLDGTTISGNHASGLLDGLGGGGIWAYEGNLTFFGAASSITGNVAEEGFAGAVGFDRGIADLSPPTNVIMLTTPPTISGNSPDNCFFIVDIGCS